MSEKDEIERNEEVDRGTAAAVDAAEEPAVVAVAKAKSSGAGVAWLALLVAIIALAAVAYTIYDDWRTQRDLALSSDNIEDSISTLGSRIEDAKAELASIETLLAGLAQADVDANNDIESLDRRLSDRLRQVDGLPLRVSNLEAAIATLQGVSTGARDTWLLGEAEYYMQLANAQLQLAGNPELAALALGMADERIAQLANPSLTNIRVAIANEVAALNGMQTSDVEGITLTLASLARVVDTLPLRQIERAGDEAADAAAGDAGRIDRAWAAIKQAASGMIKYRSTDETIMPLISPEAEYFLRTNLSLQLQTARLAMLRGEKSAYEESLADAKAWIETYFDLQSTQVTSALQTIDDVSGLMAVSTAPDISESLRLLRQYNSVTESLQ